MSRVCACGADAAGRDAPEQSQAERSERLPEAARCGEVRRATCSVSMRRKAPTRLCDHEIPADRLQQALSIATPGAA